MFTLSRDHYATEQAITDTSMAYTFLRDNLYLDFAEQMVGADGVIRGPAGDGRAAMVARADVARVALAVLQDPAVHAGRSYDLTGPAALTLAEIAAILSDARATKISFHDETLAEAYASRQSWAAPAWQVEAWVSTYTSIAVGEIARVSGDVELVTGRRPLGLAALLANQGRG